MVERVDADNAMALAASPAERLPRGAVVETWGVVSWNGAASVLSGAVPPALLGMLQSIIAEEELAVEAALSLLAGLVWVAQERGSRQYSGALPRLPEASQ